VPECDVLFVYAKIENDGAIADCNDSLEKIIALSGATIVIVATGNSVDAYVAATRWLNSPSVLGRQNANLVMTVDRRDALFVQFFVALFTG
jgi:hypothetical protein